LLPAGLAMPGASPSRRCALTAPFHPCRTSGPCGPGGAAVYFLWRFPWGRPRRTLSGAVSPWSPDFPLPCGSGSPQPLSRPRFKAPKSVGLANLIETGVSRRPFARPHRLPLSGSPGWGQRSRPASSTASPDLPSDPFDPDLAASLRFPGSGAGPRSEPVARRPIRLSWPFHRHPLPSGAFTPRDRSTLPVSWPGSLP
jgi:hypothetical protein